MPPRCRAGPPARAAATWPPRRSGPAHTPRPPRPSPGGTGARACARTAQTSTTPEAQHAAAQPRRRGERRPARAPPRGRSRRWRSPPSALPPCVAWTQQQSVNGRAHRRCARTPGRAPACPGSVAQVGLLAVRGGLKLGQLARKAEATEAVHSRQPNSARLSTARAAAHRVPVWSAMTTLRMPALRSTPAPSAREHARLVRRSRCVHVRRATRLRCARPRSGPARPRTSALPRSTGCSSLRQTRGSATAVSVAACRGCAVRNAARLGRHAQNEACAVSASSAQVRQHSRAAESATYARRVRMPRQRPSSPQSRGCTLRCCDSWEGVGVAAVVTENDDRTQEQRARRVFGDPSTVLAWSGLLRLVYRAMMALTALIFRHKTSSAPASALSAPSL